LFPNDVADIVGRNAKHESNGLSVIPNLHRDSIGAEDEEANHFRDGFGSRLGKYARGNQGLKR
jgi:hypothetical protein